MAQGLQNALRGQTRCVHRENEHEVSLSVVANDLCANSWLLRLSIRFGVLIFPVQWGAICLFGATSRFPNYRIVVQFDQIMDQGVTRSDWGLHIPC